MSRMTNFFLGCILSLMVVQTATFVTLVYKWNTNITVSNEVRTNVQRMNGTITEMVLETEKASALADVAVEKTLSFEKRLNTSEDRYRNLASRLMVIQQMHITTEHPDHTAAGEIKMITIPPARE